MSDENTATAAMARQLFDAKAAMWSAKYVPGGRLTERLQQLSYAVQQNVAVGENVLDLGCGTGELTRRLAATGFCATGCDISSEMLNRAVAADTAKTVTWIYLSASWQKLPVEDATFGAIVASSVLEYVDDPVAVLRECVRVLQPAGLFLLTVPNVRHPVRWLEFLLKLAARTPLARAACRKSARLHAYSAYLLISQKRRSMRGWQAVARRSGLVEIYPTKSINRHRTLRLLAFRRSPETKEVA